jgi:hypothetical protein
MKIKEEKAVMKVMRLLDDAYDSDILRAGKTRSGVSVAVHPNWDYVSVRQGKKIMLLKHGNPVTSISGVLPGGYNIAAWDAVNALVYHDMINEWERTAFFGWVADEGKARRVDEERRQLENLAREHGFVLVKAEPDVPAEPPAPSNEKPGLVFYRLGGDPQDVIESKQRCALSDSDGGWFLRHKSAKAQKRPLSDWDYEELTGDTVVYDYASAVQWVTTGRF